MTTLTARNYIAGSWVENGCDPAIGRYSPFDGAVVGNVHPGSPEIAESAIAAAREAFENGIWASEPRLRSACLLHFADELESRKDEIARLLSRENGRLLEHAHGELAAGIDEARYYAGLARNIFGRTFEPSFGKLSMLTKEPAGVVAVIVPWNAPITLFVRSVAPAFAAGCTVVVKPASQTALVNAALIECFNADPDLPLGVINSVNENGVLVGQTLSTHPEIDVISFTGSTETGKRIMASASTTVKRVSLELGGKAPAIVFPDADLSRAVKEIMRGSLMLNGQMCTAISRVLLHEKIAGEVLEQLAAAYRSVQVGDPLASDTQLGPVVDHADRDRLLAIVNKAVTGGVNAIVKGERPDGPLSSGAFITPSIFEVKDCEHWLVQNEHFGPILTAEIFENEGEAIARANATQFGLAASVYTRDLSRTIRISRKLKFGTVWVNCHNRLLAEAETGGFKQSGLGRLHGAEAVTDFLETKHIYVDIEGQTS